MKKLAIGLSCVLAVMALTVAAVAKSPGKDSLTISWYEAGTRCDGAGVEIGSWSCDPNPYDGAVLVKTGKGYHFEDVGQLYNQFLPDITGSVVISGSGRLSGHSKYTSLASGLPIRERFKGQVVIYEEGGRREEDGTMTGQYAQWSYAFGTWEEVTLKGYNPARGTVGGPVKEKGAGWWLIGYTEYEALGGSCT